MKFKYEKIKKNYAILASGHVIQSFPGQPAFPIRIASELFQRCGEILKKEGNAGPYSIYDPLCGGGYLVTCLGLIHATEISKIFGSDVNPQAIKVANANVSLLTPNGLNERISHLESLYEQFGKDSHKEAIENARFILKNYLSDHLTSIHKEIFPADCFDAPTLEEHIHKHTLDIIISDLPYGKQTLWDLKSKINPIEQLLISLTPLVKPNGLILLISETLDKSLISSNYLLLGHLKIGHRHILIIRLKHAS